MAKKTTWHWTPKYYEQVWKVLKPILEAEPWNKTVNDEKLAEQVMAEGVFCTRTIIRAVRLKHGIGGAQERRVVQFGKTHKKGQK